MSGSPGSRDELLADLLRAAPPDATAWVDASGRVDFAVATRRVDALSAAIDHVVPLARPSTLKKLPKMLTDRDGPLTVHGPSIPYLLPWMARFGLAAYSEKEVRKGVDSAGYLTGQANLAWQTEIQASGLGELFKTKGALYVYENEEQFTSSEQERQLQKAKGLVFEVVDGDRAFGLAGQLEDPVACARADARRAGAAGASWSWPRTSPRFSSSSPTTSTATCPQGCAPRALARARASLRH